LTKGRQKGSMIHFEGLVDKVYKVPLDVLKDPKKVVEEVSPYVAEVVLDRGCDNRAGRGEAQRDGPRTET
jgi:hypothetical protein